MRKVTNYLWMFMMAATVLFVASCGEDVENPVGNNDIALSSPEVTIEDGALTAAPGQTFSVYVSAGDSEVTAVTNGGSVTVGSTGNTATNDSIDFTVSPTAQLGTTAEITFTTSGGLSEQLTVNVGYESIVDVVTFSQNPNFSILRNALGAEGVLTAIADAAPVTLFAPTDNAFRAARFNTPADLPDDATVASILSYHVVEGKTLSTNLQTGSLTTLEGSNIEVTVQNGAVSVNGIPVTITDIETADGNVVHVIDANILNPTFSLINSSAVLLGAQGNSANGSFYNAVDNQVLRYTQAQANSAVVDLLYYWGATNNHTIARLGDDGAEAVFAAVNLPITGFTPQPETEFLQTNVTSANFDAIISAAGLRAAVNTDQEINQSSITGLTLGSVFLVELADDRGGNVGLARVAQIGGPENGNGTITLDMKLIR